MNLIKRYIRHNRSNQALQAMGIVIHNTENLNDNADMEFAYFDKMDREASAHAFIDDNKIIQTIPWNEVAWHAGPKANHTFIGIEMCTTSDQYKFLKIWNDTTDLVAFLFVENKWIVSSDTILSHADVSNMWKETDHQDPIKYFAKFGKTMYDFRMDVSIKINAMLAQKERELKEMELNEAIKILTVAGVIGSPDYWLNAVHDKKLDYLDVLIINSAKKIKELSGNAK